MSSVARQEGDACGQLQITGVHTLCALEPWLKVADKTPGVSGTGI